jgi:hypothetical protein
MQRHKSQRHVNAARARWHAAELRADQERAAGTPDRGPQDSRQPVMLALSALGWRDVVLEPRLGYVSWRCADAQTGEVLHCAASKELLRWIAGQVPRLLAARNFH